jgi:ParB/Sulfiredoxin domain
MAAFEIKELPLEALRPAQWNANVVPPATLKKIGASIEDFGVVENLVVRPHPYEPGAFEVISGNHRLELYRRRGMETAPCYVVELDDARARLLAQTLNRTRGEDDPQKKAQLLEEVLQTMTVEEALRYLPETPGTLDRLLTEFSPSRALLDPDEAPPLPEEPDSKPGELYELGPHRLLCGDATDPAALELLMGEALAELLWTDPPYGVAYAGKNAFLNLIDKGNRVQLAIAGDDGDAAEMDALWRAAFAGARAHLSPGASYYVTGPQGGDLLLQLLAALRGSGFPLRHMLTGRRTTMCLGAAITTISTSRSSSAGSRARRIASMGVTGRRACGRSRARSARICIRR